MTVVEQLTIDSTVENAANDPLALVGGAYVVTAFRTPTPGLDPRWAQPADADGDRLVAARYLNRQISVSVEIVPSGATKAADAQAALAALAEKVAKVNREGGTLRRVLPSGDAITFDLLTAEPLDPSWDASWDTASAIALELTFTAKPFARGAEQALAVHAERTRPVLTFVETGIAGDVPALGRLVVTDGQGIDQRWVVWGLQTASYDAAASADLFYEAESRTPRSGGTVVTESRFASTSGVEATLGTGWRAILSTNALRDGSALTHRGRYRVFARLLALGANLGDLEVGLEWAEGDFRRFVRNDTAVMPRLAFDMALLIGSRGSSSGGGDGGGDVPHVYRPPGDADQPDVPPPPTPAAATDTERIVDLGLVDLEAGAWEGRVVARSTASLDRLRLDWIALVPAERSGEASAARQLAAPDAVLIGDSFDQAAGNLNAVVIPSTSGRTWLTSGSTTDFTVDATAHTAKRVASGTRYAIANVSVPDNVAIKARVSGTLTGGTGVDDFAMGGLVGRWTDASNHLRLLASSGAIAGAWTWAAAKVVAGSTLYLGWGVLPATFAAATALDASLVVSSDGMLRATFSQPGVTPLQVLEVRDASLQPGATLASGLAGMIHRSTAGSSTAVLDEFEVFSLSFDAAVLASRSLEIGPDRARRQNASGTLWSPVSRYEGDYLTVPLGSTSDRTARFIVKGSRTLPTVGIDAGIDDLSAQLHITPRYLVVP